MRHVALAVASSAVVLIVALLFRGSAQGRVHTLSMATAYAGMVLLAASLLIGPVKVLRRRSNPVSQDLRRDVGIWAAILGVCHTVLGLQVHLGGRFMQYFIPPAAANRTLPIRFDAFGLTNYAGLAATLSLLVLLALSNDLSLRRLGLHRWKALQRANYVVFGLVVGHGAIYQLLEKRMAEFVVLFGLLAAGTVAVQLAGFRRRRGRA